MDRVAQFAAQALAACADVALIAEAFGAWDRAETRKHLTEAAERFGFDPLEISAAIDTALRGR